MDTQKKVTKSKDQSERRKTETDGGEQMSQPVTGGRQDTFDTHKATKDSNETQLNIHPFSPTFSCSCNQNN